MARRFISGIVVGLLLTITACKGNAQMNIYNADMINDLQIASVTDAEMVLSVTPILESAYALAGAMLETADGVRKIKLVRCKVGKECEVDVPATIDPDARPSYLVIVPHDGLENELHYKDGSVVPLVAN